MFIENEHQIKKTLNHKTLYKRICVFSVQESESGGSGDGGSGGGGGGGRCCSCLIHLCWKGAGPFDLSNTAEFHKIS